MRSREFSTLVRFVPMFAAGVTVFLGLILLGGLTGLLWHISTFVWWVKLSPSILGPTADWFLWAVCFLLTLSPAGVSVSRERSSVDPLLVLICVMFPLLSLVVTSFSYYIGATLLVGSSFLAAYALVSRSSSLLGVHSGLALRVVSAVIFGLLALVSAVGTVSVLLWREDFLFALVSGSSLTPADNWLSMLAVDMEVFYLARPLILALVITLAFAALVALFREPLQSVTKPFLALLLRTERHGDSDQQTLIPEGKGAGHQRLLPSLVLLFSLALGVATAIYPYVVSGYIGVLGVDSWFYIQSLQSMNSLRDALPLMRAGRSVFIGLLFLVKSLTGLSVDWVVRLMPALLSVLLALSTFFLVKEGTDRLWASAFAALLSVVSAQTALGMSAGIITNWFALSIANFMFALIVRSIRLRSKLAALGALLGSVVLLGSYSFLWVVVIAELALVLAASLLAFWRVDRREWKREVSILSGVLSGSILLPIAFVLAAASLLGFRAEGIDPNFWFTQAWVYLARVQPQLLGSVWGLLEETFDVAGNRIDLPFLTLLSIIGLLDSGFQGRVFNRIVAATAVIPTILVVIISISSASPYTPVWLTWRGLYVIPLFVMAALGAESIVRRVNGKLPIWGSPSRLAFTGTFVAYIFLSHLSYSLRALELLIVVASRA